MTTIFNSRAEWEASHLYNTLTFYGFQSPHWATSAAVQQSTNIVTWDFYGPVDEHTQIKVWK